MAANSDISAGVCGETVFSDPDFEIYSYWESYAAYCNSCDLLFQSKHDFLVHKSRVQNNCADHIDRKSQEMERKMRYAIRRYGVEGRRVESIQVLISLILVVLSFQNVVL